MSYPEPEPDERQRIAEEGQLLIGILLLLMPNGSRKELAARSGVSRRTISLYERGLRRPQRRTRQRMADSINVDLSAVEALFPTFERLRASTRGGRRGAGGGLGPVEPLAQRIGEAVRERVTTETATIFEGVAVGREVNSSG
jgi:transcriptional regulator with XRE-family HTH domain